MSWSCPKCNATTRCLESRRRTGPHVRRRFECEACGCRFSTAEIIVTIDGEAAPPVKRTGYRASLVDRLEVQAFQRYKI